MPGDLHEKSSRNVSLTCPCCGDLARPARHYPGRVDRIQWRCGRCDIKFYFWQHTGLRRAFERARA